jgi:hypothetical protein
MYRRSKMQLKLSIDGAVGEVLDGDGKGRVCVLVNGEREWWHRDNAEELMTSSEALERASMLTPTQLHDLISRLEHGGCPSAASGSEALTSSAKPQR